MKNELHPSQVYSTIIDYVAAKTVVIGLGVAGLSLAVLAVTSPPKDKPKLAAATTAIAYLGMAAKQYERTKKQQVGDIGEASRYGFKQVVASLVQVSSTVTINQDMSNWVPDGVIDINDLAAMLNRLHGRIIGGSGTGKSVLAKALVRLLTGEVLVFDAEATKQDWKGFQVLGRGENWDEIGRAMINDLKLLSNRVGEATSNENEAGWDIFKGKTCIRVVEEYPDCKDEVNTRFNPITEKSDYKGLADEWCQRLARRGRKPGILLLPVSQYDNVTAWGFEGKGNLVNCFHAIRLGQFAIDHANRLGDKQLAKWLEASIENRCMVDNKPCQLPTRTEMILIGGGVNSPAANFPTDTPPQLPPPEPELNELETYILEWGKRNPGIVVKARVLQQSSSLFKDLKPEDIRIILASLADREIGETVDTGHKLGWRYPG